MAILKTLNQGKKRFFSLLKSEHSPVRVPFTELQTAFWHRLDDKRLFISFPEVYNRYCHEPIQENKIVIVGNEERMFRNDFGYLYQYLKKHYDFEVHVHFLYRTVVMEPEYRKNCRRMLKDIATARCVFISDTTESISCISKRRGTDVVQLWHACGAFKRFGYSTADLLFGMTRQGLLRHPSHRNYTLACVSSPEVVWAFEEAMGLKDDGVIRPTGVSRTDIFFNDKRRSRAFRRLYEVFPGAKDKKVLFYAPTFRGKVSEAAAPDRLDYTAFYESLGDEYVIVTKHHPFVKQTPPIPRELEGTFAIDITHDSPLTTEDMIFTADVCISDYSSLIYEYSLFLKPMVFFAYDIDDYNDWRGFFYDYDALTPGPVFTTNEDMIDYIAHIRDRFDKKEIEAFRDRFMSACDGHATERILSTVLGEELLDKYRKKDL